MTPEERDRHAAEERERQERFAHRLRVCVAASCRSLHGDRVLDALKHEVGERGLGGRCQVKGVGCMGACAAGPLVAVEPADTLYRGVSADDAAAIVDSLGAAPVERLRLSTATPFFGRQTKIVLENAGVIDPESVGDYIARDGYAALLRAVTEMSPSQVVEEVVRSGLRGRGGAGYPTGLKWTTVAKAARGDAYVVCNADEGDPGAFMDRSVLESDPHRVLEGMAIAAHAVGASHGYVYVRAEYPLAVERLHKAIQEAEPLGLLGENIAGTPFRFHLEIRIGAGAFVCGEETALIASIEGKRGTPRPRPPYPAELGVWGKPTLINNVETFANIPPILRRGGAWFAGIGTERSKGTKVFALAGRVNNSGVIEVPMGMTLREIVFDIGGGIPDGARVKAVQTGGPSGGCIPEAHLDIQVDYDTLAQAGSIMGSGGMVVMDDTSCMVDVAKFFMDFCRQESCGKCVPCRVGTVQMHDLLHRMTSGAATADDMALLEELCDLVKHTSLCGLGQAAPNPVLSTLRHFRDEYVEHVDGKRCRAGVCPLPGAGT